MYTEIHDLHTHILPGLDDGAPDSEVAQQMLKMAAGSGTTELYATPHLISGSWQPPWAEILHRTETLNRHAVKTGLGVRVLPGAEVAMDWSLLDLLPTPGPYCLGGSRFILVELPLGSLPNYADDFLFTLQTRDFLPILAHPERNPEVKADPDCLQPWLDRGELVILPSLLPPLRRDFSLLQRPAHSLTAPLSAFVQACHAHGQLRQDQN